VSDPGLTDTNVQDVVGVFDQDLNELFEDARAVRALVRPIKKVMKHPLEDGDTITDFRVFEPVTIELSVILRPETYQDTFQQIMDAYRSDSLLTVQTKVASYGNMTITEPPHDETPDMADTVAVALKLEGVRFVTPQYAPLPASNVKKSSNASTVKGGQKQGQEASPKKSSAAYDLIFGSGG